MKITIKEDPTSEMLSITLEDGTYLFYGNASYFDRTGHRFKKLFEKIGIETELINTTLEDINI